MTRQSVQEYAAAVRGRYLAASRGEKAVILGEFCQNTGYHRKSAIRLLRHPAVVGRRHSAGRKPAYGPEVIGSLKRLWEASDYSCSKRLAPFIPSLLEALERHGELQPSPAVHAQLLALSPATIDRLLKPFRGPDVRRPHTSSPADAQLKRQIPVRTFGEWAEVAPGSLQADLVAHCGESTEGFYLTSLMTVDVATSWTEFAAVWGKGQQRVGTAVHTVRGRLPFALLELHTDNGGEFINALLYPWCQREGIRFTRGRAYRKNDQAYVEQKNWQIVRRLVGYDRYCTKAAQEALAGVYEVVGLYVNFFQPVRKLLSKEWVEGEGEEALRSGPDALPAAACRPRLERVKAA